MNTKPGAIEFELELRQRCIHPDSVPARTVEVPSATPAPTLREFATRWLDLYVTLNNRPCEQASKRRVFAADILPALGDRRLDEITSRHIEEFKARLSLRGLSNKTVNNALTMLRKCLATAVDWEELSAVPRFRFLKLPPLTTRALSREQQVALLDALPPMPWRLMALFALRTGLRFSELIGLEWRDVNFETKVISVVRGEVSGHVDAPKNGRVREVPLTRDAVDLLRMLPRCHDRVFTNAGRPIGYPIARWHLRRACTRAGIAPISWHVFRHSFATDLNARGADIKLIRDLLGHATLTMTLRYTHTVTSTLRSAVALLDDDQPAAVSTWRQPELKTPIVTTSAPQTQGPVLGSTNEKTPRDVRCLSLVAPRGIEPNECESDSGRLEPASAVNRAKIWTP